MSENELPEGWVSVRLEELGDWGSGGTPLRTRPEYFAGGTIPWLKIGDLNDGIVTSAAEAITDLGLQSSSAKLLPKGVLLVAMYGSIGKLGITGIPCATNQAIAFCQPCRDRADLRFLFWMMRSKRDALLDLGKGGTQQNISQTVLRAFEVPIPPLAEQQRVVAQVEKLVARVNAARERLARVPTILKRFRQAVLAASCEGRLTEEWRERNVTASSNPVGGTQDDGEGLPDLPQGWRWTTVGDVGKVVTGNTPSKKDSRNYGGRIPFFKPTDLNVGYEVSAAREFLSEAGARSARVLSPLAVMVTCIGATIGKTGLSRVLAATNQQINSVEVDGRQCSPFWLFWVFNSDQLQEWIRTSASETTLPILNKSRFGLLPVPLPPIPEQSEIVRRVEALFKLADVIEKRVAVATARAERLTQAILARAFRGELVPTEAELARREGGLRDGRGTSRADSKRERTARDLVSD